MNEPAIGTNVRVTDAATTREVRRAALRPHWPPGTPMPGDDAPDAVHLATFDERGAVTGACVLLPRPCPAFPERHNAWQLRGMAAAERGTGTGRALTDGAVAEVARRGGSLLWCDARQPVIGFYERHGFTGIGTIYAHPETGGPHLLMVRELPGPLIASGL